MVLGIGVESCAPGIVRWSIALTFFAFLALAIGCGGEDAGDSRGFRIEGTEPGDCEDGVDNDADGLFDCDDTSCAESPPCADGGAGGAGGSGGASGIGGAGGSMLCAGVDCDDSNECTEDACDPLDGTCDYTNLTDGTSCDFGGLPGVCMSGVCEDAMLCASVDCDDSNQCTQDVCEPLNGECGHTNVIDDTACDFGSLPGLCVAGVCEDAMLCASVDCDDGNECTEDTCDPMDGMCGHTNVTDGMSCDFSGLPGMCAVGVCEDAKLCAGVDCDDSNACTQDVCDPMDGQCYYTEVMDDTACDFGGFPGVCTAGVCEDAMLCAGVDCDDSNECTQDVCDPMDGSCAYANVTDGTICDSAGPGGECIAGVCKQRGWGTPVLVRSHDISIWSTDVAVDPSGNAIAVWDEGAGNSKHIWSSRYTPESGWGSAERIQMPAERGSDPDLATDPSGNAVVVWRQDNNSTAFRIWSNRFMLDGGWGTPEMISDPASGSAFAPRVAIDPNGNALSVWEQIPGGTNTNRIDSNRYEPGNGWGMAEMISGGGQLGTTQPQIAMDPAGNATVVWYSSTGVWSNRYVAGSNWGVKVGLDTDAGLAEWPHVAMGTNGDAFAVWTQYDGVTTIWSRRYLLAEGWGPAEMINEGGNASSPQVAVHQSGDAFAVWVQGNQSGIWSNRYTPASGWGTPQIISNGIDNVFIPRLAIDAAGNAIVVWHAQGAGVWSNRYRPVGGWGTAELISGNQNGSNPKVAVDVRGNATVVWQSSTGVWSNRFE